jgi:hypothetical protein
MNISLTNPIVATLLAISTLLSGVWLSHSGKPLNIWIVTLHKMIAVITVIAIGMIVRDQYKALDLRNFLQPAAVSLAGLLFLALIATGALLTREEMEIPGLVLKVHQVAPLLALAASATAIYLLAGGRS